MKDTHHSSGVRRNRWPLDLDTHDPEGIAEFCLGLDYPADDVVNALVQRCNLDVITARQIVAQATRTEGSQQ